MPRPLKSPQTDHKKNNHQKKSSPPNNGGMIIVTSCAAANIGTELWGTQERDGNGNYELDLSFRPAGRDRQGPRLKFRECLESELLLVKIQAWMRQQIEELSKFVVVQGDVDNTLNPTSAPIPTTANSAAARAPVQLPTYRSPINRAIEKALIKDPDATDLAICQQLDDNDDEDLSAPWKTGTQNRTWTAAYREKVLRKRIHSRFDKVRRDMRRAGLL